MPPEVEPFVLAVVVALASAWVLAYRALVGVGEKWQKIWLSLVTVVVVAAAAGFSALIGADLLGRPRTIAGTVQSVGDRSDRISVPTYAVVVDGRTYWTRPADYQRLRVGTRIQAQAGAVFNFLRRVEVLPVTP